MKQSVSNSFHVQTSPVTPDDTALLRNFVAGSEEAFAELVRRRIGLVYSVALRQTRGDCHRAKDVCQAVFTDLARKAPGLLDRVIIGWLYRSAQFAAAGMIRAEQRRQNREIIAQAMHETLRPEETNWETLRPTLDEVLNEIDERDRDVILLRFFDERSFAEIGNRLRLTENAARMRVERALERLGSALGKRGITSTSAALGIALGQQIGAATPAGLATSVAGAALTQAAVSTGGWVAGIAAWSKLQVGVAASIAIGGAAVCVVQQRANAALRESISEARANEPTLAALRAEHRTLSGTAREVEQLRRDDLEFKQLAENVADLKKTHEEQSRAARVRAAQHAQDRDVQAEIDRLNREGNALVGQYKELAARAKDPALTTEQRAAAESASKLKLVEIQAKQREVKAVIAAAREANPQFEPAKVELKFQTSIPGRVEAGKAPGAAGDGSHVPPGNTAGGDFVSIRLPGVDVATALTALETMIGGKIARDPSLASVSSSITFQGDRLGREEAARRLTTVIREQFNVILERAPDGTLVAKHAPAGWSFRRGN